MGILPAIANPAETPIRSCSLIPTLMKRSGKIDLKMRLFVDLETSGSTTTILLFFSPISTSINPKLSLILLIPDIPVSINLHHLFL